MWPSRHYEFHAADSTLLPHPTQILLLPVGTISPAGFSRSSGFDGRLRRGSPDLASHVEETFQLGPLIRLSELIAVHGACKPALRAQAQTFEPLRFVPQGKVVVLGLLTTKAATLESVADITRRLDEAGRYVPLERLCLSPQCGFASTVDGNQLTETDQWAKLERLLDVTRQVWRTSP